MHNNVDGRDRAACSRAEELARDRRPCGVSIRRFRFANRPADNDDRKTRVSAARVPSDGCCCLEI